MTDSPADPAMARIRAATARARLLDTLGAVQERLKPTNLAQDAVASARQGVAHAAREGARAIRSRPWVLAAASGAVGLLLARGWIADILRGRKGMATDAPAAGLDIKDNKAKRIMP